MEELVFFVDWFLTASVLGYDPEEPWEVLVAATVASILLAALTDGPPRRDTLLVGLTEAPPGERAAVDALKYLPLSQIEGFAEQRNPDGGHISGHRPHLSAALPTPTRTGRLWRIWVCWNIPVLDLDSEDA
ncbi:hypothetical protein [Arthrobacter globiformis]|uniref:hypothetical protein n=1 Tax=Arthrobacter globiformis TaxID=1665 RepID=UPI0027808FC2|nr:hypothetical protein [Arthrobacter globiformis]MDQ0864787.1 hypothetical protein [Arthrobacter globiformis]